MALDLFGKGASARAGELEQEVARLREDLRRAQTERDECWRASAETARNLQRAESSLRLADPQVISGNEGVMRGAWLCGLTGDLSTGVLNCDVPNLVNAYSFSISHSSYPHALVRATLERSARLTLDGALGKNNLVVAAGAASYIGMLEFLARLHESGRQLYPGAANFADMVRQQYAPVLDGVKLPDSNPELLRASTEARLALSDVHAIRAAYGCLGRTAPTEAPYPFYAVMGRGRYGGSAAQIRAGAPVDVIRVA